MAKESIDVVTAYLDGQAVDFELVKHEERFTAAAEAQASGVQPDDAAKDLILRDGDRYLLAVIPASRRLDLGKARELLEASRSLRLATEEEIGADFDRFELGAALRAVARNSPGRGPRPARARVCAVQLRGLRARRARGPERDGACTEARVGDLCED